MIKVSTLLPAMVVGSIGVLAALSSGADSRRLARVSLERVCTTLGEAQPATGALFRVDAPKLRATIAGSSGKAVSLAFAVLGATEELAALASGELRSQLGLELLARDQCNVLYVMWRQGPQPELVVQVKQNAGQSTHAECENRGYRRLRPTQTRALPVLELGKRYTLAARVQHGVLEVTLDGKRVWQGRLDPASLELGGRVGLRSDNLRFEAQTLSVDLAAGTRDRCSAGS
jgi:hypothetical protein